MRHLRQNACGVGATGCGITISHNLIHDGPRMGVQMSGNIIIVEYNHMHHLVMETQDGGAIYTGGRDSDQLTRQQVAIQSHPRHHRLRAGGRGPRSIRGSPFRLYPDDNTGGVDIIGNLVYRCAHTRFVSHNSRDCIVENNVFAFGERFQFDLHGWTKEQHYWKDHGRYPPW